MQKADKLTKGVIIGSILGLILGGAVGYLLHNNINQSFFQGRGNFQIDEQTKIAIEAFFNSASNISEIESYCQNYRANCLYYCRSINQEHEICSQIMPMNRSFGR